MYRQMTIFDFLGPAYPDIRTITEAEAVRIVGDAIGVKFAWSEFFGVWIAKKGKIRLNLKYSNFNLPDNNDLFLSTGYDCKMSGGGAPCKSIEEAIKYLKTKMEDGNDN